MIEPEMAFADLEDDMRCAEDYVQHCCRHLLATCMWDPFLQLSTFLLAASCVKTCHGFLAWLYSYSTVLQSST